MTLARRYAWNYVADREELTALDNTFAYTPPDRHNDTAPPSPLTTAQLQQFDRHGFLSNIRVFSTEVNA